MTDTSGTLLMLARLSLDGQRRPRPRSLMIGWLGAVLFAVKVCWRRVMRMLSPVWRLQRLSSQRSLVDIKVAGHGVDADASGREETDYRGGVLNTMERPTDDNHPVVGDTMSTSSWNRRQLGVLVHYRATLSYPLTAKGDVTKRL